MPSRNTAKTKKSKWDERSLDEIARLYASRSEFAENNKPAYEASRLLGLLDKWFGHKLNSWSEESVRQEATRYTTRTEFAKCSGSAYNAARRLGIIDQLYPSLLKQWGVDEVRAIAKDCANKKDLKRTCATAYNAALRLQIIDELFHNQSSVRHRDCVYLWSVQDEPGLYKVGITSHNMGIHRITQVAKEARVTPLLIFIQQVGYENAKIIEKEMKKLGQPYKFARKFYGHSEFRYLTPDEVGQCIKLSTERTLK